MKKEFDDFPGTIYKFRDWDNKYHKKILLENEIFFANANSFNDPFDSIIPNYGESHLSKSSLISLMRDKFKRENPSMTEGEISIKIQSLPGNTWIIDEAKLYENLNKVQDYYHKKYGIISLSENPFNILMWGHYSNAHKGFCVGFDTKALANYLIKEVNEGVALYPIEYVEKIPVQDKNDNDENLAKKMFFTKNIDWKYEKEWRLIATRLTGKTIRLPKNVFKDVILGFKMEETYKSEIISFCKNELPHVKIFQSEMRKDEYNMKIRLIK